MLNEKKVLILVERDFQDLEVFYPYYRLKEEGTDVKIAGAGDKTYVGKFGLPINTNGNIKDFKPEDFDCIIIPGGWAPDFMRREPAFAKLIREMNNMGKVVASICHGGWMLCSADIVRGKTLTSYSSIKDDLVNAGAKFVDKSVVVDGNLITSRKPDDLPDFCREIIKKLRD